MVADPKTRFTETADDYHRFRPTYPAALVDWILEVSRLRPGARVVDVGCGTGISTRLFAVRGFDAAGIDPNPAMLAYAERVGGARYLQGEASRTGLPDGTADLVVVAQAFHWFDVPAALAEFRRILRPGGWCSAFWNVRRTDTPLLAEYDALLCAYSSEYAVADETPAIEALKGSPGMVRLSEAEFPNLQRLDRAGFMGRVYSSSYVRHGIARREAFDRELAALFDRHRRDGHVEFLYRTIGFCWQPDRAPG